MLIRGKYLTVKSSLSRMMPDLATITRFTRRWALWPSIFKMFNGINGMNSKKLNYEHRHS